MTKDTHPQPISQPANPEKNNPLGQRVPSAKVGGPAPNLKHNESAELVEEVKRKADDLHDHPEKQEKHQRSQNEEELGEPWP